MRRHRHTTAAAALITAGLLATGCSTDSSDQADATPKPTKTTSPQEKFLNSVEQTAITSWADAGPTDDELLLYPPAWCTELDSGHSVEYVFAMDGANLYPIGMDWGTQKAEAQELLVLGVTAYCPEHREQVTAELRAAGY